MQPINTVDDTSKWYQVSLAVIPIIYFHAKYNLNHFTTMLLEMVFYKKKHRTVFVQFLITSAVINRCKQETAFSKKQANAALVLGDNSVNLCF